MQDNHKLNENFPSNKYPRDRMVKILSEKTGFNKSVTEVFYDALMDTIIEAIVLHERAVMMGVFEVTKKPMSEYHKALSSYPTLDRDRWSLSAGNIIKRLQKAISVALANDYNAVTAENWRDLVALKQSDLVELGNYFRAEKGVPALPDPVEPPNDQSGRLRSPKAKRHQRNKVNNFSDSNTGGSDFLSSLMPNRES